MQLTTTITNAGNVKLGISSVGRAIPKLTRRRLESWLRIVMKIVGMKLAVPEEKKIWAHYNKDDAWFEKKGTNIVKERETRGLPVEKKAIEYGKDIIGALVKFMTAGPVVMIAIEGNEAIAVVKKLVGGTEPATSDVGTIRGDYTSDSYAIAAVDDRAVRNLIHCSDNPDDAKREVELWFDKSELLDYRIVNEAILYDVNLDGIME
jgi:nucleoside-diphosphate kinase